MAVRVIIHMFKIMRKPIKVGVRTYVRDVCPLSNPGNSQVTFWNHS